MNLKNISNYRYSINYLNYIGERRMSENVLECDNLCKKIGKKEILNNVSFSIKEGDILGFIGPNGARKNDDYKINIGTSKNN